MEQQLEGVSEVQSNDRGMVQVAVGGMGVARAVGRLGCGVEGTEQHPGWYGARGMEQQPWGGVVAGG
ncbi:hypothetical protein COCNU_14G003470 [Cocos nucifera]|uniref:Uncharacterized protein n=1 Tax=Cocos nucifera TaxID=13894 RepID=A0A8K0IVZ9_COCNU|nr:hypothetical protein COCNU_14G003470 [Cocos nucifera]